MLYVRIPVQDVPSSASFYSALLQTPPDIHPSLLYAEVETDHILIAMYGPEFLPKGDGTPLDRKRRQFCLPAQWPMKALVTALRAGARRLGVHRVQDPNGHRITFHTHP